MCLVALPLLAQRGVNLYSLEKERAMGEQYAAEVRRQHNAPVNPVVNEYVKRVGAQLVAHLTDRQFEYEFEAISGGEIGEPIALPGGFTFVPVRAILEAQDEAELVGMMTHAIAHVALRLDTRQASRAQIVNMASIPLIYMGGWTSHAPAQAVQRMVPVTLLNFQRKNELQADRFGLELASRAGYDPLGYLRYVERTQMEDSEFSPLPNREERLASLRETASSLPRIASAPSGEEFRRVQELVRAAALESKPPRRVPRLKR